MEEQKPSKGQAGPLLERTKSMRRNAMNLLRNPDFFGEVRNALERQGIVAQFSSATLTYIAAASAPLGEPLNIVLAGPTSADINFIARRVLRLVAPEAICEIPCTAAEVLPFGNDRCEQRILYLPGSSNKTESAQFVLNKRGLLAQYVENFKDRKRHVTLRVANGPFVTIGTTESLRIEAGVPYVSAWVGSKAQQRPVSNESVPKESALSDRELGIWREVYRVLEERCSWLVILPYFLDMILDLMPRDSFIARNIAVLTKTVEIIAVIRSFQSAAYPTKIPKTAYLYFVDFEDYAIAATILNAAFAEAHPRESQFFPAPEVLIRKTSWVRRPIEFVHPLTGERVTLYPSKRRRT